MNKLDIYDSIIDRIEENLVFTKSINYININKLFIINNDNNININIYPQIDYRIDNCIYNFLYNLYIYDIHSIFIQNNMFIKGKYNLELIVNEKYMFNFQLKEIFLQIKKNVL